MVVNKRRRNAMKDLMRVIEQEAYEYSDPITQFLECLFVRYDFEGAQVRPEAARQGSCCVKYRGQWLRKATSLMLLIRSHAGIGWRDRSCSAAPSSSGTTCG